MAAEFPHMAKVADWLMQHMYKMCHKEQLVPRWYYLLQDQELPGFAARTRHCFCASKNSLRRKAADA
eukprot:3735-Pelagomonas_calceolata.AAC.2